VGGVEGLMLSSVNKENTTAKEKNNTIFGAKSLSS
jgi:hypothetical protein